MSRLSGAVGALRGYQAGRMQRDGLKLKLADELRKLREYEETTLPESQAKVRMFAAQAGREEIELETAEELFEYSQERGISKKTIEALEADLIAKKQASMTKEQQDIIDEQVAREKQTRDYGSWAAMEAAKEKELGAVKTEYDVEVLRERGKLETTKQTAERQQREEEAKANQIILDAQFTSEKVTGQGMINQIMAATGVERSEAELLLLQSQAKMASQKATQFDEMITAMSQSQLEEFSLQPFKEAQARINNLLQTGKHTSVAKEIQQAMLDYAKSPKGDLSMLFGWYGYTLRQIPENADKLAEIMKKLRSIQSISGVSDRTSTGGSRQGVGKDAFSILLGLLQNPGEIDYGKDDKGMPIKLNLKDFKDEPEKMSMALDTINLMLAQFFEDTGVDVRIEEGKEEKRHLRPFWTKYTVPTFEVKIEPFEYVSPATINKMKPQQKDKYNQRLKAHEKAKEIEALARGLLDAVQEEWRLYSEARDMPSTRSSVAAPGGATTRTPSTGLGSTILGR